MKTGANQNDRRRLNLPVKLLCHKMSKLKLNAQFNSICPIHTEIRKKLSSRWYFMCIFLVPSCGNLNTCLIDSFIFRVDYSKKSFNSILQKISNLNPRFECHLEYTNLVLPSRPVTIWWADSQRRRLHLSSDGVAFISLHFD